MLFICSLDRKLNLDPDPELVTDPDLNLQIISDPAGSTNTGKNPIRTLMSNVVDHERAVGYTTAIVCSTRIRNKKIVYLLHRSHRSLN
jgi:hypothetical protein